MPIRFKINEGGERVASVHAVWDPERAIDEHDCPIIGPAEAAGTHRIPEFGDTAEWDRTGQGEEGCGTNRPRGEQ